LAKKATCATVPSLSVAVAASDTGVLIKEFVPLIGLVSATTGGTLAKKVEFCAPGVP